MRPWRVIGFTLAATLMWPLQELTGGQLMRNGHHAAQVVALRYITHLILLAVIVLPLHGRHTFVTRRPVLQFVRGLCMFGMAAGFIMAYDHASVRWIWTIFWLMPAMALCGAAMLLRERVPPSAWVAAAIGALAGATVMGAEPAGVVGTLLSLVMGGSFAGYVVLSRVLRHESLNASLFYTALGAVAPVLLVVGRVWTPLTLVDIVPALLTGLLSITILGSFDKAAESGPVWLIAPLIPLVLIWETAIAAMHTGTPVYTLDAIGIVLAAAGAVVVVTAARFARTRITRAAMSSLNNG